MRVKIIITVIILTAIAATNAIGHCNCGSHDHDHVCTVAND